LSAKARLFEGKSKDDRFYPIIFTAEKNCAIDDEAQWAAANPSLGITIRIEDLRHKCQKAKESPSEEAKFRRLHLNQFVQGSSKWLDMHKWDAAVKPIKTDLSKLPLYLGLDLSVCDDLSSLAAAWIGKVRLYVKLWTFVPAASARKYELRDEVPFSQWAKEGHVRLLESETVDDLAQKRIANLIVKLSMKNKLRTLGYDKYRASAVVAQCERAGVVCVPVRPDYEGMSAGCHELERRLKAPTIVLPDNPCARWQAANVEVVVDRLGNIRPVKEHSGGTYGGRRGAKIDAIVALVIALSQAKRHEFNDDKKAAEAAALAAWDGQIAFA
jgi:phage terminase large subunit-like protein